MKYRPNRNIRVTSITHDGFWITICATEYYCTFEKFPWFRNGTEEQIKDVQGDVTHLFWDELDIDLNEDSFKRKASVVRPIACS